MSTVAVLPPFPFFTGRSGEPLDAGFVFIGAENQDPVAVPIAIFWDSALTIPAPNPVRTSAGYLSRSGAPGVLFAASNYSMRVADKGNTQLYVIPSSARVGLGDITLSSGETLSADPGSQILVKDGANLSIGDNTGVGANTIYADSARFIGNFIPRANGTQKIGDTDKLVNVFANAVDATLFTKMVCSANNPVPTTQRDLVSADQNKSILVGCRTQSNGATLGTAYNVLSCVEAAGVYTYVLDVGVDDNAEVLVSVDNTAIGISTINIPLAVGRIVVDGTGKNVIVTAGRINLTTATFLAAGTGHFLTIIGRPRTTI